MSEHLIFNNVTLDGPIAAEDLSQLRAVLKRGANDTLPYVDGDVSLPTRIAALDVTLTWFVTGRTDPNGTPYGDWEVGVEQNVEFYRTLFTTGADVETGEHEIDLHRAGSVFTGFAQVKAFSAIRTGPSTQTLVTRMIVAAGELAEGSS